MSNPYQPPPAYSSDQPAYPTYPTSQQVQGNVADLAKDLIPLFDQAPPPVPVAPPFRHHEVVVPRAAAAALPEFDWVAFEQNRTRCPKLVLEWLRSLWGTPIGFLSEVAPPREFETLLVPHVAFHIDTVSAKAVLSERGGMAAGAQTASVNCKADVWVTCCVDSDPDLRRLVDDGFFEKWNVATLCRHDPSVTPTDAWETERIVQERHGGGLLNWFLGHAKPPPTLVPGESHLAVLPDAAVHSSAPVENIWPNAWKRALPSVGEKCDGAFKILHPGRQCTDVSVKQPSLKDVKPRTIYMPIFRGAFLYKGERFTVVVNGQSGAVHGNRPFLTFGNVISPLVHLIFGEKKQEQQDPEKGVKRKRPSGKNDVEGLPSFKKSS